MCAFVAKRYVVCSSAQAFGEFIVVPIAVGSLGFSDWDTPFATFLPLAIPKPVEKSATMLCGSPFSRRVNGRAFGKTQLVGV